MPVKVAMSRDCGGLRLFENVERITKDKNFCKKDFGKHACLLAQYVASSVADLESTSMCIHETHDL